MRKKVSLKELVATKIVYALMLASYYWMWARTDWKDYYVKVQFLLGVFLFGFFVFQGIRMHKYKTDNVDEMAENNLKRCDSICMKILIISTILLAFGLAIVGHVSTVNPSLVGWILILSVLAISIIRTIIFVIMDNKGV